MNIEASSAIAAAQPTAPKQPGARPTHKRGDSAPQEQHAESITNSDVARAAAESVLVTYPPPRSPVKDQTEVSPKDLPELSLINMFLKTRRIRSLQDAQGPTETTQEGTGEGSPGHVDLTT